MRVRARVGQYGAVHKGLLHTGVWSLATAAAAALSWFGVHSVLRETVYDPPRALPVPAPTAATTTATTPGGTATRRPGPTPTPGPGTTATPVLPPQRPPGTARATVPVAGGTGSVHAYALAGGHVVLDLARTSASLVSATPDTGWQMKVWTQSGWLRVTFTSADGSRASSLLCTWNGHPPSVQSFEDG